MCFLALSFMLFSKKIVTLQPVSQLFRRRRCIHTLIPWTTGLPRSSNLREDNINYNYT